MNPSTFSGQQVYSPENAQDYQASIAAELRRYEQCLEIHDLPDIFHYWSNRHIRPKLLPFGFSSPNEMFGKYLLEQCKTDPARTKRFVSLGSGNCDLEISLGLQLRTGGHSNFVFDCIDLNPAMLERGKYAARQVGLAENFSFVEADLNVWCAASDYDAALANQSLHHVVNLESLCAQIAESLRPGGRFIIADMIGRNGHQRWPEALAIVQDFWRHLPPSYKFNHRAAGYEEQYDDRDCSGEGFEGVRSQDILPVLLQHFQFRVFIPFGNVIDPFVDRGFGPNFDATKSWDREFIDAVHACDEEELESGRLKPTHLLAVASPKITSGKMPDAATMRLPEDSIRVPGLVGAVATKYSPARALPPWGADILQRELDIACRRLRESAAQVVQRTTWALDSDKDVKDLRIQRSELLESEKVLEAELATRTAWALNLERQLASRTQWALQLERDLTERTARLLLAEASVAERTNWALTLEKDLHERTAWALELRKELEAQTVRAERMERGFRKYAASIAAIFRRGARRAARQRLQGQAE